MAVNYFSSLTSAPWAPKTSSSGSIASKNNIAVPKAPAVKTTAQTYTAPTTNSSTRTSSSSSSVSGSSQSSNVDKQAKMQADAAKAAQDAMRAQIDSEYGNLISKIGMEDTRLTGMQTDLQNQLPITEQQIGQSYESVIPELQRAQQEKQQALSTQQTEAQQGYTGVTSTARQNYNELLSGANRFGGSAGAAYGELLGRGMNQTVGAARNELVKVLNGIQSERGTVQEFYNQKIADLGKNKNLAIEQARADFRSQLDKINQAKAGLSQNRVEAERWKSTQNLQALSSFQQRVADIQSAALTAKNSIDQWIQERDSALTQSQQQAVKQYKFSFTPNENMTVTGTGSSPEDVTAQLQSLSGSITPGSTARTKSSLADQILENL